ncbi:hypothetical protein B0H66DRAFT_636226 [Apodospora peruviana]|uniref:Uncharacterized protein n=1 Tax=Apodospora peruviana TaxID=516989 RepID=A0AAE0IU61_9PEZI|nr:hypothetical protein B0H66DRAFT_636226 [Apodospora peruviana]
MLYRSILFVVFAGAGVSAFATNTTHHDCGDTPYGECGGVCGDGKIQHPYEQCDLGPALNGAANSGCSKDCKLLPVCGNEKVEEGETCDLGFELNGKPNSGCSDTCCVVPKCGDGHVDPGEQCDLGTELNGKLNSGCTIDCKICPVCGNGKVEEGEACDLGSELNGKPNSGCSDTCCIVPKCGDGHVDPGEQCDLGPELNGKLGSSCTIDCKICPVCGNGKVEEGEECDAGSANGAYNSGCSTTCELCGYCGDGKVDLDGGEACDLGWKVNGTPGSTCSSDCKVIDTPCEPRCGDGVVQPGEQCDDGDKNGPHSRCTSECKWSGGSHCGNGITEWPEECDDGDLNGKTPNSKCSVSCTFTEPCGNPHPPVCGNGIVEEGEACDAGYSNGSPGSTCTKDCRLNTHPGCQHNCPEPHCGDGIIQPGEECDDGVNNGAAASNCDKSCKKKNPDSGHCATCNPNPFFNKCTITTSCIGSPSGATYCACRAGYRANGIDPSDTKQFRLAFPGQEYRVFVAPGIECDTLCTNPHPGPDSCQEVPVRHDC